GNQCEHAGARGRVGDLAQQRIEGGLGAAWEHLAQAGEHAALHRGAGQDLAGDEQPQQRDRHDPEQHVVGQHRRLSGDVRVPGRAPEAAQRGRDARGPAQSGTGARPTAAARPATPAPPPTPTSAGVGGWAEHVRRGAYSVTTSRLPFNVTDVRGSKANSSSPASSRVVSVISTSSPISRVAASTRAAVLTVSPITANSTRPPPPTVPATTGPVLTPMPTPKGPS